MIVLTIKEEQHIMIEDFVAHENYYKPTAVLSSLYKRIWQINIKYL